jgi:formate dehydrogenase (hydrogenase)
MGKLVRLTEPLVRVSGELRPASWDEALDRAAAGLAVARAVMGSNNIDSCNRT